jgi:copper chaperone CopZ
MKRARWLWIVAAAFIAVSCRRQDVRKVLLEIPDMKNDACVRVVTAKLKGVPGVRSDGTVVDRRTRTVTVAYDSLILSRKNIEFAVAEAGFSANGVPADAKAAAALPPACAQ